MSCHLPAMVSPACIGLKEQFSEPGSSPHKENIYHYKNVMHDCGKSKFRDFCGDCAGIGTAVKLFHKTKSTKGRQQKRYKPFRSSQSSWKNSPFENEVTEISHIPRDHMFLKADKKEVIGMPKKTPSTDSSCFIVKIKEMNEFFKLADDPVIQDFLQFDSCKRIADRYLLAMVFAYFKRANISIREYTRMNFFIGLYLANDVEEDEEEIKYEIFPWVLGTHWKKKYPSFLKLRDSLLRKLNYRAIISRRCCDEIMAIQPDNNLWKRERPLHHGGAVRNYMKDPSDDGFPRGPNASPRCCPHCDIPDSQYDSASPGSTSWFISSKDTSPIRNDYGTIWSQNGNDDVWPSVEE